jgi:hypothetical protein
LIIPYKTLTKIKGMLNCIAFKTPDFGMTLLRPTTFIHPYHRDPVRVSLENL